MKTFGLGICLLLATFAARADVVTTLSFTSPSTTEAGGAVSIDLGVNFTPLPALVSTPTFSDVNSGATLSSCASDQNPCTEAWGDSSDSVLDSVSVELTAAGASTPNVYEFSSTGTFPLTLSYPNPGVWDITLTGSDEEQFSVSDCTRVWFMGTAQGPPTCVPVAVNSFSAFDTAGTPELQVNVLPATAVPEPASFGLLLGGGFLVFLIGGVSRRVLR